MRVVALLLIALGTGVAASFGAQNGTEMMTYRQAVLTADLDGEAVAEAIPSPSQRLSGWWATGGFGWLLGLSLVGVGGVLLRRGDDGADASASGEEGGDLDFAQTMDALIGEVQAIRDVVADLPHGATDEASRSRLDGLSQGHLASIVTGRTVWMQAHGLAGFAEYFGIFSGGERYVARAWTGLADGRPDVSMDALNQAVDAFSSAKDAFQRVEARLASG